MSISDLFFLLSQISQNKILLPMVLALALVLVQVLDGALGPRPKGPRCGSSPSPVPQHPQWRL